MKRGTIVLTQFPFTDLSTTKRRPAVIVSKVNEENEFPDMKGFSSGNLKYMRAFAEAWSEEAIVQQLAAQIS